MSASSPSSVSGRLGRFASFNVAQQVWLAALSLVATPILYHRLGETGYGILAVVNVLASQLAVLELGFGHATIRWVARSRDDAGAVGRVLGTSLWVFLATAAAGAALLLLGRGWLVETFFQIPEEARDTAHLALGIGALFFAASILGNLGGAAWQGFQRFDLLNLIGAGGATLQLLGSVALVLLGYGVVHVVVWSALLATGLVAVHAAGLRRELPPGGARLVPDRDTFREMAGYGILLMGAGLLLQVYLTTGSLVLGHYVLVGVLPFFTVPFGIFQRLYRMAGGLSSALFPLVAELDGARDRATLDRVFVAGTRTLLLAGVVGGVPAVLLAGPFLEIWMGAEFAAEATPVLELLFLAFVLVLATVPAVELSRGSGNAGRVTVYVGVLALVNVVGVVLLAPRWGVEGAAAAFLSAQTAGSAFLLARAGGRRLLAVVRGPLLATVGVAAALGWTLHAATEGVWERAGAAVGAGLALAVLTWLWALTDDERNVVSRVVGGIGGRG